MRPPRYMAIMAIRRRPPVRVVNVADLKNKLSRYLREVREGEEILVRDRNVPIAKIVPLFRTGEVDAETEALVAAGKLRPAERRATRAFWREFWSMPAPRVSIKRMVEAIVVDREED